MAGPAVLLLPGAGARCDGFFPGLVESLEAEPGSRVIVHDVPETLAGVSAHLHDLVARLGTGPVVVVGQSMGGAMALLFACDHPEDVAGLVLLDVTPINDAVVCARVERAFRAVALVARVPFIHRMFKARMVKSAAREAVTLGMRPDCAAAHVRTAADADLVQLARAVTGLSELSARFDETGLPRVPAAVITADRKPAGATHGSHRRIAEVLGEPLLCWPGSTHSVHLTHPDEVLDAVRDVLGRAQPGRTIT
ncbi:MAG: alpha/beta fold hydrolase [Mycobacterium sp.]